MLQRRFSTRRKMAIDKSPHEVDPFPPSYYENQRRIKVILAQVSGTAAKQHYLPNITTIPPHSNQT